MPKPNVAAEVPADESVSQTPEQTPEKPVEQSPAQVEAQRRTDLENSVGVKIAKMRAQRAGIEIPDEPKAADEATGKTEGDGDVQSKQATDGDGEAAAGDTAPILPAAHRRSLIAYEWTKEEIEDALKQEGPTLEAFFTTASKIHETRNKETARLAEAGRARIADEAKEVKAAGAPATEDTPTPAKPASLDITAIKEEFGDNQTVIDLANLVNDQAARLAALETNANKAVSQVQSEQEAANEQKIVDFFESEDLKGFREFYGESVKAASDDQREHMNKVLELADALLVGSELQGRALSTIEALDRAHDSVSIEFQEKRIRDKVKEQATTRHRGKTLRPGNTRPEVGAPANSKDELAARIAQRRIDLAAGKTIR